MENSELQQAKLKHREKSSPSPSRKDKKEKCIYKYFHFDSSVSPLVLSLSLSHTHLLAQIKCSINQRLTRREFIVIEDHVLIVVSARIVTRKCVDPTCAIYCKAISNAVPRPLKHR